MSNTKHTPGPWRLLANQGIVGADGDPVATAPGHPAAGFQRQPEERIANARLIAAAPEMLVALLLCVDAIYSEAEMYRDEDGGYQPHGQQLHALADSARAAIAKATAEGGAS